MKQSFLFQGQNLRKMKLFSESHLHFCIVTMALKSSSSQDVEEMKFEATRGQPTINFPF